MKQFAIKTIKEAGDIVRKKFKHLKEIRKKSSKADVVTEADILSSKHIIAAIKKKFPTHSVLSEEQTIDDWQNKEHLWITDPLDGTRNFAHNIPFYAICLSYKYKGDTKLALIYDPTHDELFVAEKGKGAYLNNKKITVNNINSLDHVLMGIGSIRTNKTNQKTIDIYKTFQKHRAWITSFKCAALTMAYTACGRLDLTIIMALAPWDIDAGVLIGKEAGASVKVTQGLANDEFYRYNVLMANPKLFKLAEKVIKI